MALISRSKASLQLIRWSFYNFRHNRDVEAKELFRQACRADCYNLQAYMNLQNTKNKMARWHFRMLNDHSRNTAFKKAIQYYIRRKKKYNVLDIGSGTGLLSMYAANVSTVESVHAIECCEIMSKISEQVFSANPRGKVVKLVTKHSKDLEIGEDIPAKASLIVSETLDCGAFGEGILDTLIHAKENLLEPNGIIVPWKIRMHVAGYRSKTLCANKLLVNRNILDYVFLGNNRLVAKNDEPYDAEYVDKIEDFKFVTNIEMEALEVNFNNLSSMQKHFEGIIKNDIELLVTIPSEGYLDGFVVWFTLYMNECDITSVITTAPGRDSCWPQAIFKMRKRVPISKDDILKIAMSCKDGVLTIHHELDVEPDKVDLEVDPSVLQFLNDDEYLRELEFAVGKHRYPIKNCLDYTPFPFVGLMLLKEAKIHKLYCKKKDEDLIKIIAEANMISASSLEFLEDPIFDLSLEFTMILLHPFHPLGDLDSQVITDYPKYSKMLACRSLMVPQKISVYGELIHSDFLVNNSRVTNSDLKRMKIDKFINENMTEVIKKNRIEKGIREEFIGSNPHSKGASRSG